MNLQIEINKRDRLLSKITELSNMISDGTLKGEDIDKAVKKALDYIDISQSSSILVAQAISRSKVLVGDTELDLYIAIEILESLQRKIDLLNVTIKSRLDNGIINTMEVRDKLCVERDNMADIITMSSWKTEISS